MKKNLFEISNSLIMLKDRISNNGLITGKMGCCIFLYHSAKITGTNVYNDIANDLLDEITTNLYSDNNLSFSNGLIGVRYGIGHLLEHNFIETDSTSLFINMDEKIDSELDSLCDKDLSEKYPLFSVGFYILDKFKNHEMNQCSTTLISDCIDKIKNVITDNFEFNTQTILYLNSVLYFLNELTHRGCLVKSIESAIEEILITMIDLLDAKSVLKIDFNITSALIASLNQYSRLSKEFVDKLEQLSPTTGLKLNDAKFDFNRAWQNLLFFSENRYHIAKKDIDRFIKERINTFFNLSYNPDVLFRYLFIAGLFLIKETSSCEK